MNKTGSNPSYIFPQSVAHSMSSVSPKIQYESTMFATSIMMIGLVITVVYFVIYFDFAVWYKIVLVINGLAGLIAMGSMLTTTYQQYLAYMNAVRLIEEQTGKAFTPIDSESIKKIRKSAGLILLGTGTSLMFSGFLLSNSENINIPISLVSIGFALAFRGVWLLDENMTRTFIKRKTNTYTTMKGGIQESGIEEQKV